jgi:phospholipase C
MNPQQRPDDPVKHVVLLMFENHSFDQMLGCFKQVNLELAGVDPKMPGVNRMDDTEFKQVETMERQMLLDPRHEVNHVQAQMENHNGGFVADFVKANPKSTAEQRQFVMGYYPLDFLPALHRLGREFMICDHWFSSLPGPTWPNRFFALTGTSSGKVNMPEDGEHGADIKGWFEQDQITLFDRLGEKAISWKIYFHDIPQSICLMHQRQPDRVARYFPIEQFLQDAGGPEDDFPAFCFIEPDYSGVTENDDHPPRDVMKAQELLADVYNALRANPQLWESTLLVVLYDEHGGFYDHIEPPSAVPPCDPQSDWEYTFGRFGIRVPAILISPWVEQPFDTTVFDHTSLLKYLIEKWDLGPLGNRTAQANSIRHLIRRTTPRTATVVRIELTPDQLRSPNPDLEEKAVQFISSHHRALALIGRRLQLEMLRESPLTFAWLSYALEVVLHWLFGLGSRWAFRKAHERAKQHWSDFREHRRRQAIPKLASIIRDPRRTHVERQHAIETLGLVANERFHHSADPVEAAEAWLRKAGPIKGRQERIPSATGTGSTSLGSSTSGRSTLSPLPTSTATSWELSISAICETTLWRLRPLA